MKFLFLFLLLVVGTLFGRENPFFPVDSAVDIPLTTNQIESIPPLKRASLKLPSSARTVESVTVTYQNLDGSIASKKINLHNSIDWHLPVFISQNYDDSCPKSKQPIKKEKVVFRDLGGLKFIRFYEHKKELKIVTHDKMLRHFLLVKPHRIVCDFKRDTNFGAYKKVLPKNSIFKTVRLGTHDGYYRVVLELDGYYQYSLHKNKDTYIFVLR
jgi:hypothetical protein